MDLPIPNPQLVTAEAPRNQVGGDAFQRTPQSNALASGMEQLGAGISDLATTIATKQGQADAAAAVSRDADGNQTMGPAPDAFILGPAGLAYHRAAEAGMLANGQIAVGKIMTDTNNDFQGKPQELFKAGSDYAQALKTQYPGPLGEALSQHALDLTNQYYRGQVNQQTTQGLQNDKTAIIAQIGQTKNDMLQLASQGGTETPEFKKSAATLQGYYGQLTGNPLFGMPAEKADIELKNFTDYATGLSVTGQVDRIFNKGGLDGGRANAQKFLDDNVVNAQSSLSQEDRQRLRSIGMARLEYLSGERKAATDAIKPTVDSWFEGLNSGKLKPDDPMFDTTLQKVQELGYSEGAARMNAARFDAIRRAGANGLSNGGMLNWMQGGGPASNATGVGALNTVYRGPLNQSAPGMPSPQDVYGYLKSQGANNNEALMLTSAAASESGLNPNVVHDNGIGFGLFGHNGSRLVSMHQFASDTGQPMSDWRTQAGFALKELRSRPEAAAVANATSPEQLALGQMYFERPQGFTENSPESGHNFTGRLNTIRRFASLDGSSPSLPEVMPKSSNGVPYTKAQVDANPFLLTAYVQAASRDNEAQVTTMRQTGEAILAGLNHDQLPAPEVAAMYHQAAMQFPDKLGDQAQKIQAAYEGNNAALVASTLPGANGQSYVTQMMQMSQGASLHDQLIARVAQDAYSRRVQNLKNDPWGEAAYRGWAKQQPDPLNFSDPNALAQGMAQRGQLAQKIGSQENNPDQSMISPQEMPQVKAVATGGSIDQRLALLGAMANPSTPDRVYHATVAKLASDSDTQTMAAAGRIARDNPDAARGILQGQALLQSEPRLAPKAPDQQSAMMRSLPANDFRSPDDRAGVMKAATAYYANLSASANDTSQGFNQDRWDQSIKAVTGGVFNFRGANVVAPWYGASEPEFRGSIQRLTPADTQGAITADGSPFPASALQSRNIGTSGNWRLQSVGSGQYLVFSGDDANRRYVQRDRLDAHDPGGAFVLDLSGKKGTVSDLIPGSGGVRSLGFSVGPALTPDKPDMSTGGLLNFGVKPTLPVSTEIGQQGRPAL